MANDGKFISAHAPDHIRFAKSLFENFGYFGKKRRARVVAEGVVNLFQLVKVDEQNGERQIGAPCQEQRLF